MHNHAVIVVNTHYNYLEGYLVPVCSQHWQYGSTSNLQI